MSDRLSSWIPAYQKGASVTIRQLLEQTSGVPDYSLDPGFETWSYTNQTPQQILNRIDYIDLHFEPGGSWEYSNTNYLLLGMIVEKASGMPYAQYVRTNVTAPLHLDATGFPQTFMHVENVARGYRWEIKRFIPVEYQTAAAFSAGALASNVTDLITWDTALLEDRVLPHDLTAYGFGVEIVGMYGHVVIGHAGNISGFSSYTGSIRDTGAEMAILTNATDVDILPLAKTFVALIAKPI